MNFIKRNLLFVGLSAILTFAFAVSANAQKNYEVLTGSALTKVVPKSFYFAGQSAETQMRNTAAAKIGKDRFIIAGMVDTSGYSTESDSRLCANSGKTSASGFTSGRM